MALSLIMKAILLCGTAVVVTSYVLGEQVLKEKDTLAFQILDRNRNGWLSVDEFLANFDRMDTNGDGMLTVGEYSHLPAGVVTPYVANEHKIRSARDGRVTEDEIITFFITELRIPLQG